MRSRASSKPTTGTVTVDGEAVNGPSAERGMVFQQYSLFPWKTVRENVEFGLKMRGMDRSQRERAARTLLGLAGLEAFEKHYPDRLSGGMKQRVGIVRALATGPKVLLLDEPFGALDAQTRVIMQQILTNMWQRLKISVLFVTHDIDEAIFLSDRVYCMTARPGSIKAEIPIPLERPRQQSMMMSSEFLALRRGLMSLIREESLKAMGGEISDLGMQGLNIELHGQFAGGCALAPPPKSSRWALIRLSRIREHGHQCIDIWHALRHGTGVCSLLRDGAHGREQRQR